MSAQCQVSYNGMSRYLPCEYEEGGGRQCERQDPHGDDGHWWSKHTIEHERRGNGYACSAMRNPAPPLGRMWEIREEIMLLQSELAELEALEKIDIDPRGDRKP